MPKQSMSVAQARAAAAKLAEEMGYELVDVELVKEPAGRFLRFYVEKGEGVTLDELEAFHRRILPLVENVDYDYLEVSSPGADRPLRTDDDFERAMGIMVEAHTYRPVNGAKQFVGTLAGADAEAVTLLIGQETISLPRREVSLVKPYLEFDEDDLKDDAPGGADRR